MLAPRRLPGFPPPPPPSVPIGSSGRRTDSRRRGTSPPRPPPRPSTAAAMPVRGAGGRRPWRRPRRAGSQPQFKKHRAIALPKPHSRVRPWDGVHVRAPRCREGWASHRARRPARGWADGGAAGRAFLGEGGESGRKGESGKKAERVGGRRRGERVFGRPPTGAPGPVDGAAVAGAAVVVAAAAAGTHCPREPAPPQGSNQSRLIGGEYTRVAYTSRRGVRTSLCPLRSAGQGGVVAAATTENYNSIHTHTHTHTKIIRSAWRAAETRAPSALSHTSLPMHRDSTTAGAIGVSRFQTKSRRERNKTARRHTTSQEVRERLALGPSAVPVAILLTPFAELRDAYRVF